VVINMNIMKIYIMKEKRRLIFLVYIFVSIFVCILVCIFILEDTVY